MLRTKTTWITFAMLIAFIMLVGLPVQAQEDFPRSEIFGGYSYASVDSTLRNVDRKNAHGWALSLNGNVNKFFGVTFDMAGHYGSFTVPPSTARTDFRAFEFLFGPTVSARSDKVTGFAHFLLGPTRMSFETGRTTLTQTKFSMGIGGGVDFNVSKNVALRAIEVDYLPVRLGRSSDSVIPIQSAWSQNVRLKTGIVFKF